MSYLKDMHGNKPGTNALQIDIENIAYKIICLNKR
jgi:hypothetical protein